MVLGLNYNFTESFQTFFGYIFFFKLVIILPSRAHKRL